MGHVKVKYPVDYKKIGKRIQERRNSIGMTQQAFAESMDLSTEYVSRIENGKIRFNLIMLYFIADKLKVRPEELLIGTSVMAPDYLDEEFAAVLHACTPEKKKVIYNFAKDILEL